MNIVTEKLDEALAIAKERKDNSLQDCLNRLQLVDENMDTITSIYDDFAPLSFYFVRNKGETFRGNGGIIFHGKHDNGGDGGAPTFSVSLTPTNGWSIHT
jgi:hypothetical protein